MAVRKTVRIQPLGFESPVERAAAELAHYLPKLAEVRAKVLPARAARPAEQPAEIVLGTSAHLAGLGLGRLPEMHALDDAIALVPKGGALYLAGSNPRSVLFAAYRLLEELGAAFLRPGPGGEVLPRRKRLVLPTRLIRESASYRHRGMCIEGAPRLEHVLDLLDWMAKRKMNAFQLQFRHAGAFWRAGYQGPEMEGAPRATQLTDEDCGALDERVIARARELGMMVHRVGHGWTSFTVGLPGGDWEATTEKPARGKREWLAQVGGKRDIFEVPVNTELCYSKREVREAFVEEVLTYARQHSEVDMLHVWMSDSMNNKCECAGCRRKSPSDWYAMLVEEIGRRMKAQKIQMKIVFLGYLDLLWPPEKERIISDNVIFMYAPITRCFRHALADEECDERCNRARPRLNRCHLPTTNRAHAGIAKRWRKVGFGDSFLFDYHLLWPVWQDGLGQDVGAVMAQDVKDLHSLGLNGFMSCQCMRAFYPLPYLPNAMADMLWDREQSVRAHRSRVMSQAFGRRAEVVERYFARMQRLFQLGKSYEHRTLVSDARATGRKKLAEFASFAEDSRRRFNGLAKREKDPVVRTSLELAAIHAEHAELVARAYGAGLDGDAKALERMRAEYEKRLRVILREYSPWVDSLVSGPVMGALRGARKLMA